MQLTKENHGMLSLLRRALRKLFAYLPKGGITKNNSWRWLRYYPAIIPSAQCLQSWNSSHWLEYDRWLQKHALLKLEDWFKLQQIALVWQQPPRLSIITPVHNTDPHILYECILSVRAQAYPYWQLILVDDASTQEGTKNMLASGVCADPRIQVHYCQTGQGISAASNRGIEQAQGDYVIFLDHDDRLALEALFYIAKAITTTPNVDIVYTDRDLITQEGSRYMHLFKPDWSPETLLSGNYVFHLMCYRRHLLSQLGGLRSQYDGSQDYDLVLRAAEYQPMVHHIRRVLYHWRQHELSVALHADAKNYAFAAGLAALNAALQRREINGKAIEMEALWRGHYSLKLAIPALKQLQVITLEKNSSANEYASAIASTLNKNQPKPYVAIINKVVVPISKEALQGLAAWLTINHVGLVCGKIIDQDDNIVDCGMAYKRDGSLITPYRGFPETEPGYMAVTKINRNISAPNPFCVLISHALWQHLEGFDQHFLGPHALLDFALRASQLGWRSVIVPEFRFMSNQDDLFNGWPQEDEAYFANKWRAWLQQGDPYYNSNLDENSKDMGINI